MAGKASKSGKIHKELKAPDHFVSFWGQVGAKAGAHRREILIAVGALVALAVIVTSVRNLLGSRSEKVSQDFARVHRVAVAPLWPEGKPAPGGPSDDGVPHFKTEAERAGAALKEADDFLAAHGGSALRDEALLYKGRLLLALKRAPEAVTLYSDLVGKVDERLRFLAQEGLAYAEEAAAQPDQAIATLTGLAEQAKGNGGFFRDRALFHKARLLEGKGAAKDAEKIYRDILAEAPTSALKEEINNRLASFESK